LIESFNVQDIQVSARGHPQPKQIARASNGLDSFDDLQIISAIQQFLKGIAPQKILGLLGGLSFVRDLIRNKLRMLKAVPVRIVLPDAFKQLINDGFFDHDSSTPLKNLRLSFAR